MRRISTPRPMPDSRRPTSSTNSLIRTHTALTGIAEDVENLAMRSSALPPSEYLTAFFDTGAPNATRTLPARSALADVGAE